MKKIFNNISIKKLLLCTVCSVMIMCLIHTSIFLFERFAISKNIEINTSDGDDILVLNSTSQENNNTIATNSTSNNMDYSINSIGEDFGDDYNEQEAYDLTKRLENGNYDDNKQENYYKGKVVDSAHQYNLPDFMTFDIPIGIMIGVIVYIVFIQKAKGKTLVLSILVAFIIVFFLHMLFNTLNYMIGEGLPLKEAILMDSEISLDIWNISEPGGIVDNLAINYKYFPLIIFPIIFIIVYVINYVRQKILVKKLNEALKKRNLKK